MPKGSSSSVRHDAVPRDAVIAALAAWAEELRSREAGVVRVGAFGSYARGDYVPSSDLDVFVELAASSQPRPADRIGGLPPPSPIPVGVELFVYTSAEVESMRRRGSSWLAAIEAEAVWV